MNGSRPLSSPPPNWPSMRRRCQCSIPGAARPRPATSGRSRVMTGPGAFRSARRARFASDTTDAGTDAVGTSDASTCWHRFSADDRTARRGERHSYLRRSLHGPKLLDALADLGRWTIEIVTRPQSIGTFKPEAWVMIASVQLLSRRLARASNDCYRFESDS